MIDAVDLRRGRTIIYEGQLCVVHDIQHVAKGNKRSYMQAKLRSLADGSMREARLRVDERLETPFMESKEYEFLYREGDRLVLMDLQTYDQTTVDADLAGDAGQFLKPNEHLSAQIYNGQILSLELPFVVELAVADTPPVVRGATATNQFKEATLETGARVRVPAFIEPGVRIRVDTRTGEYVERAK